MVEVVYTFPQFGTDSILTMARITMDAPVAGAKPAATAQMPATASTCIKSITWDGALDSNGCFQGGVEYTAYITLGVKDGLNRTFSTEKFDAEVNGVAVDEVTRVSDTELIVPVEFEKTPGGGTVVLTQSGFTDVASTSPYAQAVSWAVASGVTNGTGVGTFSPGSTCTRGQIAAFLYRAFN